MPMGNKKPKGSTKAPLAKGGWFCLWQNRGDKRPAGFHIGWYFEEVPTVNPSVTPTACQLPLAREPRAVPAANTHGNLQQIVTAVTVDAQPKAPLAKGGCLGLPRRGDSPGEAWELLTYYLFTIH